MDAAPLGRSPLADLAETVVILRLMDAVARRPGTLEAEQPPAAAFLSDDEGQSAEFATESARLADDGEPSGGTPDVSVSRWFDDASDLGIEFEVRDPTSPITEPTTDLGQLATDHRQLTTDESAERTDDSVEISSPCLSSLRGELDLAPLREIARQAKALHDSLVAWLRAHGVE